MTESLERSVAWYRTREFADGLTSVATSLTIGTAIDVLATHMDGLQTAIQRTIMLSFAYPSGIAAGRLRDKTREWLGITERSPKLVRQAIESIAYASVGTASYALGAYLVDRLKLREIDVMDGCISSTYIGLTMGFCGYYRISDWARRKIAGVPAARGEATIHPAYKTEQRQFSGFHPYDRIISRFAPEALE